MSSIDERALHRVIRKASLKVTRWPIMRWIPTAVTRREFARLAGPQEPWPEFADRVPEQFRGTPGNVREPEVEKRAHEADPLRDYQTFNNPIMRWVESHLWRATMPSAPYMWRARRRTEHNSVPAATRSAADPATLTAELKRRARELGISAVGVAPMDDRYMFDDWKGTHCGNRVVVVAVEQNWSATQAIPSAEAERAAFTAYSQCMDLMSRLAPALSSNGYQVQVHDASGPGMTIHFAVEAGLGQLGLNGQLLTPQAGSRCRIMLMVTDAPLELDTPRDYGIPKLCDECQVCVRRCPPGAIPKNRSVKRGVLKAPINTKRCLPVMAASEGCGVCIKVCPVQRYGLERVYDHWEATGEVLGKGTDELEGYTWPVDGTHYEPGSKPRITPSLVAPPQMPPLRLQTDPTR